MNSYLYRYISCLKVALGCLLALPAVVSCTNEVPEIVDPETGASITVSADIANTLFSRTYIEKGQVDKGTLYISYPTTSNNVYATLPVQFGVEGVSPQIGLVQTGDPDKKFAWTMVSDFATPTFYLDNVSIDGYTVDREAPNIVIFDDTNNPFRAGKFDDENGTNDLLWGEKQVSRQSTNTLVFDLHHYMSRIRLEITVDKTNVADDDFDLETGAKVSISSINQTPVSYNRLDGTLALDSEPKDGVSPYSELTFVNIGSEIEAKDVIGWAKEPQQDPANEKVWVYTTYDFVVPPQGLLDDENRPRLTIETKNGKTYSGILPHAMLITDPNKPGDTELTYPVTMYFLKEHILTIRTRITEEPPTLSFMPVQVVQWVDKGTFSLEGHQAGLYFAQEFYKLIGYYTNYNEYQLTRYGTKSPVEQGSSVYKWTFPVFRSFTVKYEDVYGKMVPGGEKLDFEFVFNGYSVFVTKDGETKSVTPNQLSGIVKGTSSAPF